MLTLSVIVTVSLIVRNIGAQLIRGVTFLIKNGKLNQNERSV